MAAAAIHVVFGSPGGRPSLREVRPRWGTSASRLGISDRGAPTGGGVDRARRGGGGGAAGDQGVRPRRVGQQLVTQTWRFLWYRHSSTRLRLSREGRWSTRGCCSCSPRRRGSPCQRCGPRAVAEGRYAPGGRTGRRPRAGREPRPVVGARRPRTPPVCHRARSMSTSWGGRRAGDGVISGWAGGPPHPRRVQRLQDRPQLLVATSLMTRARRGDRRGDRRAR